RLAPGSSVVEAKVCLYNRTPLPQTFLWWANVAVRVHDEYQAFFPADVDFVADHAKRAVSSFPIARNSYYGVDYSPGTDISWYKNIPVPTSYMVAESKYDFCGGYDHARDAGLVHTSNHLVAPGKKLWTWGNAEFGHAWDRNLTEEDGPYVELMAGAYTDNQPDFSWLAPFETKTFAQYWYPIQHIGLVKNANKEAAINLELREKVVFVGVCVTSTRRLRVLLTQESKPLLDEWFELEPGKPLLKAIDSAGQPAQYKLSLFLPDGRELLTFQPPTVQEGREPLRATEPPPPLEIASIEELYLTGLHLEQYRHATRSAEVYWQEGLRRDPADARINNALGGVLLRKGEFAKAEAHFERAVRRLTIRNPNPYDGEPYYNLGLALRYQGRTEAAYDAFHKAVWNYAWRSAGYYALASISAERGDLDRALDHLHRSFETDANNLNAYALQVSLLRHQGRRSEAEALIRESGSRHRLDSRMKAEALLLSPTVEARDIFLTALEGDTQTLLDVAYDLAWCGMRRDAFHLLAECADEPVADYPMIWYTLSWLASSFGEEERATEYVAKAEAASPLYCFPARIEEMIVLEHAVRSQPRTARALYYLGNLYYDKRRYEEAIECWRRSVELDGSYSIPWRNLGIAEFNVLHDPEAADRMYETAFSVSSGDARVLYEWDQLKKRAGLANPAERLGFLREHSDLVARRDDLTAEFITLLNQCGEHEEALKLLSERRFSPWEGGEGLVPAQYVRAHRGLGLSRLSEGRAAEALEHFEAARRYPQNLGEGKHLLILERDLDYLSGVAAQRAGEAAKAQNYFAAAAAPLPVPGYHSYFQAQALKALGRDSDGDAILAELSRYAAEQMKVEPKIDYFATSLPNLLLFDDDLKKRNRFDCLVLEALAYHGEGQYEMAIGRLKQVLSSDPNHAAAADALGWIETRNRILSSSVEEQVAR
ncbi:MAG TPA: DUF5107 domain-containing protein, partial [Silvibacterium sp.]|nr:DUF5107 domain-containing protein [Silvibacterium sp.]